MPTDRVGERVVIPARRAPGGAEPAPSGSGGGDAPGRGGPWWARLSSPAAAVAVSVLGVVLMAAVAAASPNDHTLDTRMPMALLPALSPAGSTYLVCVALAAQGLGLLGLLAAVERGWRPSPRRLFAAGAAAVAVLTCLTPFGSADVGSYAAYGRIAALGGDPYRMTPADLGGSYAHLVGPSWLHTPSVYGPVATWIQQAAATVGGDRAWLTVWVLMLVNGAVFLLTGYLLIRFTGDPVRAGVLWAANPLLLNQLVAGGHLDTYLALLTVLAALLAARATRGRHDLLVGVLFGLACGLKVSAVLLAIGLTWPYPRDRAWARLARSAAACLLTVTALYAGTGLHALAPLHAASGLVSAPSVWELLQWCGHAVLGRDATATVISVAWPLLMLLAARQLHRRLPERTPAALAAAFALSFGWILVAPWAMPWYTASAWALVALMPRNRLVRWLILVTTAMALVHNTSGRGWAF